MVKNDIDLEGSSRQSIFFLEKMPKGALPMPTVSRIASAKQRNQASCRFDNKCLWIIYGRVTFSVMLEVTVL